MGADLPRAGAPLTERERDVIWLVAQGGSNSEIAERLHLAAHTVKSHLQRISAKLEARNRAHVVHLAHIGGWLR